MDIALVFPGCHRRGGVERLVYEVARHFAKLHEVTVYAVEFEDQGLELIRRQRVHIPAAPRAARPAVFARAVRKSLEGHDHDHLISFGVGDVDADVLWVSSVHRAWLERRDVSSSDRLRSSPLRRYLLRHQILLAMERRYFTRPRDSLAVVVADRVAADIERLYGFPRERTVTVHNGFDPDEFNPALASAHRMKMRAELGIPADAIVLLLAANELARKGLPVLLEAVAMVGDPQLHVLLVGRTRPTPYMSRVTDLGISERFHYGGSRSDMGRIYAASDMFVLPTRYEAFCIAVVEALASGLPVITTDVPGAGDLVVEDVNGRLQRDPADAGELAALLKAATHDNRYRRWAARAAATVEDHTWEELLNRALQQIAARPRRG
jgi:UDP-glucose:(heptosyl)LPS alpha-1,3-glucosyltransferase